MIILTHRDSQKPVDLRKSTTRGVRTQRVEEQLTHRGCQKPVGLQNSTALGVRTQRVFISTAMIHSDGLYNFIMVLIKTIPAIIAHAWSKNMDNTLPLTENGFPATNDTIKWYHILVTYIFTQVLAFYNAYGCGLTNWSLESINGKLAIFIFGAWVGASHGGVLAGLATCGVVINNVSTASDLMQDFKTGYLTLASPRSMFISQVIRTVMGSVIAPCVFWLFYKAFVNLGMTGIEYPAPYDLVYHNMAILGVDGFSSLQKHCLTLCYIFFAGALSKVHRFLATTVGQYNPCAVVALPSAIMVKEVNVEVEQQQHKDYTDPP
ncbi:putative metal-nicotianamine transporter YSL12 [Dendrobium catenatum]|uniref:Putative metal-nicotianamine transporter YSL12 n=1 Tax=Dendrobium catenatum TaxID=906689 RepID=A0A2I0XG74_9ASPA|nr:putative metal-nicotianamine transporter YSL12 [Dendrobium catenatum]